MDSTFSSRNLTRRQDILLVIVFIGFAALTTSAVIEHGLLGIFIQATETWGGLQIWVDLVITSVLVLFWIRYDAKLTGRALWPWVVLTLSFGVFGPLLYLLTRKR